MQSSSRSRLAVGLLGGIVVAILIGGPMQAIAQVKNGSG
jgi:hypothetical protein